MRDLFIFVALLLAWYWLRRPRPQRVGGNREWYRTKYLRSPHWIATAAKKRKEAGYKCERCHKSERLDIHHLTYQRLGHERMNDLQALCRKCHKKRHKK